MSWAFLGNHPSFEFYTHRERSEEKCFCVRLTFKPFFLFLYLRDVIFEMPTSQLLRMFLCQEKKMRKKLKSNSQHLDCFAFNIHQAIKIFSRSTMISWNGDVNFYLSAHHRQSSMLLSVAERKTAASSWENNFPQP